MHNHDQPQNKPVVVVTGSSGLIGQAVIRALAPTYALVGFDRASPPYPPLEAECIIVDVTDADLVHRGLERVRYAYGNRIASVIHLAAYYDFSGEPSDLYDAVTVRGTARLLRALQGFEVEQFLFSSTMLVHQPLPPGQRIQEDTPLEGKWAYPQSKLDTEERIRASRHDIPVVLMRIADVYTDRCDSIPIAHQIQRIYEKRLTGRVFPGDTSHGQTFVHLDDAVDAITRAVDRRRVLRPETTFLIGEPETYSYDQVQRRLAKCLHSEADWQTHQIPKRVAQSGAWVQDKIPGIEEPFIKPWMIALADDHYELDISHAGDLLGWQPRRRLLDTLPRMVETLRADPVAWYRHHKLEYPSGMQAHGD